MNLSDLYARAVGPVRERHNDPKQQGAKSATLRDELDERKAAGHDS